MEVINQLDSNAQMIIAGCATIICLSVINGVVGIFRAVFSHRVVEHKGRVKLDVGDVDVSVDMDQE
jgi:hypothetical protein